MPEETRLEFLSDERLVSFALAGDTRAFGVLVQRYWRTATAIAFSSLGDANLAEDVAQESFMVAYRKLASLRQASRFPGWLSRITMQKSVDAARRRRRCAVSVEDLAAAGLEPAWTPSANPGLAPDEAAKVRQAVERLPEKMRLVVIMRFAGGLKASEIASGLKARPSTVRVHLHRAYQRLRKELTFLAREV